MFFVYSVISFAISATNVSCIKQQFHSSIRIFCISSIKQVKFFKFVSPGNDGVPDRIAILPGGLICFVELKRDGKELRPLQEYVCGQLKELGCNVLKVRGIEEANRAIMWMKGKAGRSDPDGI